MKRLAHLVFWTAQVPATLGIAAGLAMIAVGRWALEKESELRR